MTNHDMDPLATVHRMWRRPRRASVIVTLNGRPHRFTDLRELYTGEPDGRFLVGNTSDGAGVVVYVTPAPKKPPRGRGGAA